MKVTGFKCDRQVAFYLMAYFLDPEILQSVRCD